MSMSLQGVNAFVNTTIAEKAHQPAKNVYVPRKTIDLWEKPFQWTVALLRGDEKDSTIARIFKFLVGLIVAVPVSLTGIGALGLIREYTIEKQDEAFKSAKVKDLAKQTKLIEENEELQAQVQQAKDAIANAHNGYYSQEQLQQYVNQRANITPEQLQQLRNQNQDLQNEVTRRANITPDEVNGLTQQIHLLSQRHDITKEEHDRLIEEAEVRGGEGKFDQDHVNNKMLEARQGYTKNEHVKEQIEEALALGRNGYVSAVDHAKAVRNAENAIKNSYAQAFNSMVAYIANDLGGDGNNAKAKANELLNATGLDQLV